MAKRIALTDYIEFDNVSFSSSQVRSIEFTSEDEQVDAGGFNATGVTEQLAGQRTKSVTLEVYGDMASGAMHQIFYPIHRDKTVAEFVWRKDQNNAVGATNPELRGNVKVPSWTEGATFGEVETSTITLVSDATIPLEWYET